MGRIERGAGVGQRAFNCIAMQLNSMLHMAMPFAFFDISLAPDDGYSCICMTGHDISCSCMHVQLFECVLKLVNIMLMMRSPTLNMLQLLGKRTSLPISEICNLRLAHIHYIYIYISSMHA